MTTEFEIFFTLPFLDEDKRGYPRVRWIVDRRSQFHLESLLQQNPNLCKSSLVELLLDRIEIDSGLDLTKAHLTAFLARFSYKSAVKVKQELVKLDRVFSDADALFKDLFQTSLEIAIHPQQFFQNFDRKKTSHLFWFSALHQYIDRKMTGVLCTKIREQEGMVTYRESVLGLAARSSQKRVIDSLKFMGEMESRISQYLLVWKCFQEARQAKEINLTKLERSGYQAIAKRYQQYCLRLSLVGDNYSVVDDNKIEIWLKEIGSAIRNYVDKPLYSLDKPFYFNEKELSHLDILSDETSLSVTEALLSIEMETQVEQTRFLIDRLITKFSPEWQLILWLIHGFQLVQSEVAVELGTYQARVSRQYKKLLDRLVIQIGQWAKSQYNIDLSSEILSEIKYHLLNQLDERYFRLIVSGFDRAMGNLDSEAQQLLKLRFVCGLDEFRISQKLNISEVEVRKKLNSSQSDLENLSISHLSDHFGFSLKNQSLALKKLRLLTERSLKSAPHIKPEFSNLEISS
jgi:hypothetical protein